MADKLQNIQDLQRKVGQTWEQAFEGVDKTSKSFHDLVDEFVKFVGDWKDFSDVRRDRLADYIENLDSVQDHWKDINTWVSDNSDTLDHYVGSLTDVRSLFQSISAEVGGFRRQTLDSVNVVRNLSRLANDNLVAIKQEGGLTESVVKSLSRKSQKLQEEYRTRLQLIGVSEDLSNIPLVVKSEQDKLSLAQKNLDRLEGLRATGIRLNSVEREQIKLLREQVTFHTMNLELLDENNRKASEGLNTRIQRQREYFREQREGLAAAGENALGANKVDAVTKLLKKFGMSEEAGKLTRDYGEWLTRRVEAKQNRDVATDNLNLKRKTYESAVKDRDDLESRAFGVTDSSNRILRDLRNRKEQGRLDILKNKEILDDAKFDRGVGRFRSSKTGEFVSQETLDTAFAKLAELEKQQKGLEAGIKRQVEFQDQFNRSLESARTTAKSFEDQLNLAQAEQKKAEEDFSNVFQTKFDLSEKLVENFKKGYLQLGKWGGPLGAALALALAIFHHLLKFDDEAVKTKRVIGQWADASALANTKFVTGTEVLKTMRELGEQFHINPVQVFSSEELGRIAQAQKLTGMTAQAAGNLAVQSKITGKNADTYRDSIAKGANQANRLNHSAVNLSAVQNDVLNTSRAIALSYGKNTEGLARAAGAAAALGMNLQDVENISKNLMNFESSIEAEMQAQLLTGMQLNLAKAREYALNNNLEGVASEIGRQGMDAAKFSHMNYIQQENMAKALGMSREQMSKMLIMQEINRGLTAEQVAAMTGMRKEDIEALSAQEKWQTMKQRFLEALVPLLEPILQLTTDILIPVTRFVLGPITWLAGLISRIGGLVKENNVFVRGLVGILAIGIPAALLRGIGLVGVFKKGFSGIAKLGKSIGKNIASWATGIGKAEGAGGKLKATFSGLGPARDYQGRTARQRLRDVRNLNKAREINPAGAAATSRASASMGSTVSKLGKNIGKIATGAAAAALLAGAVFILAKAAKEFEGVSWESMGKAGTAILGLTIAVLALGAIMSSGAGTVMVLAGAAAMVVMAGAVWILGNALKQVTAVPGNELQSIATGIRAIAGSVGELAVKLKDLQPRKLRALGKAFKNLKGAGIQIQTPVRETEEVVNQVSKTPEKSGESKEIKRENIEAAVQTITIKQAQVRASAQQISVEQKAADLSKIEQKMDRLEKAINSLPRIMDWNEFNRAQRANG